MGGGGQTQQQTSRTPTKDELRLTGSQAQLADLQVNAFEQFLQPFVQNQLYQTQNLLPQQLGFLQSELSQYYPQFGGGGVSQGQVGQGGSAGFGAFEDAQFGGGGGGQLFAPPPSAGQRQATQGQLAQDDRTKLITERERLALLGDLLPEQVQPDGSVLSLKELDQKYTNADYGGGSSTEAQQHYGNYLGGLKNKLQNLKRTGGVVQHPRIAEIDTRLLKAAQSPQSSSFGPGGSSGQLFAPVPGGGFRAVAGPGEAASQQIFPSLPPGGQLAGGGGQGQLAGSGGQGQLGQVPIEELLRTGTNALSLGTLSQLNSRLDQQNEIFNQEIARILQGPQATQRQKDLISGSADSALKAGQIDIERFQTEANRKLRDELAPQLGLRPTDTPIQDRGGMVAAEALRQSGQLTQNVRGQQFAQELNYPLQANQLQSGQSSTALNFGEAQRQFQEQLKQQATSNRNALLQQLGLATNTAGGFAQGLATGLSPNIGGVAGLNNSFVNGTVTSGGGSNFGSLLGGAGGLATGLGALGFNPFGAAAAAPLLFGSDRRTKHAIRRVGMTPGGTPLYRFKYRFGPQVDHIGVMADEAPPAAVIVGKDGYLMVDYSKVV